MSEEIVIDALDPDAMALWRMIAKIAKALEQEHVEWCLVGGMMVALFALEAGQIQRATTDIDILGDARQRPSATTAVADYLRDLGAIRTEVGGLEAERGFRFAIDGQLVDVLAPDGLPRPAMIDAQFETIQIPGGTQALQRKEIVTVVIDDEHTRLPRPTLIGAILLKARSLPVHSKPEDQREDLITLLGLLTDPRAAAKTLKKSERKWLNAIEEAVNLGDPALEARFGREQLRIANAAYTLLGS
ncbi:MAG TPA: hypothetical protein VK774_06505 [Solirubrobacteraceae bacterium]|jgi:hypothetical protein|nr:hypothetical protein [Solirubrobacteraceae bacterium]